jgi:hypothetical protein
MKLTSTSELMEVINEHVSNVKTLRRCKYEEYNCIVCDITINKRCKIKHDKSHKHLMKYMWNE